MNLYYHAWRYGLRAVVPALAYIKVRGLHHIPRTGGCILVGNHLSLADPPCLLAYVPRHLHFIVKAEAFEQWPLSVILPPGDPIKVSRGKAGLQALRQAEQYLKSGEVVMIYAEGTRSVAGAAQEARAGVVFLAQRTGVPIVPVAISGTERVIRRRFPRYWRGRMEMTFSEQFQLKEFGSRTCKNH